MRILHTSDWHLGSMLYEQKRLDHSQLFLDWLKETIVKENIDALLVAGDVFDTVLPSNAAEKQYYSFLSSLCGTCCKHTIITAGNHDSPSKLEVSKDLLAQFHIDVVTSRKDKMIIPLSEDVVVLAVPYLRDWDVRIGLEGQSAKEKAESLEEGVRELYRHLTQQALKENPDRILIAMGHCYLKGSLARKMDAVGTLGAMESTIFPKEIAYGALGHIHTPQEIEGGRLCYCGSPFPISFSEAHQQKEVEVLDTSKEGLTRHVLPIPSFCNLEVVTSDDSDSLLEKLDALKGSEPVWVEVHYTGANKADSLADTVRKEVEGSNVQVLKICDDTQLLRIREEQEEAKDISLLSVDDVFSMKLDESGYEPTMKDHLMQLFHEITDTLASGGDDENP